MYHARAPKRVSYLAKSGAALLFILATLCSYLGGAVDTANASTFTMDTGYYTGTGVAGHTVSGLSFQPEYVLIKASNLVTQTTTFKTSAMPSTTSVSMGALADSATDDIVLRSDGFSLSTASSVNAANIVYNWVAFHGSDCSSAGSFCVGSYVGNGLGPQTISSVGFAADLVMIKQQNAAVHYRASAMPTGTTLFFTSTANNTTGDYIQAMTSTGFSVGSSDNLNGLTYYFVAFKQSAFMSQGSYTGNGSDDRTISGVGFTPSMAVVKNSTSATNNNRRAVFASLYHSGNTSSYFADPSIDEPNLIQSFQSDGFEVGSAPNVNESGATLYWFAFSGAPTSYPAGSGSYTMKTGSYTGNGSARTITGVGFMPDLVIIKAANNNYGVFKTSQMAGNTTGYLSGAASEFGGGITSLDSDGFSLGAVALVNTTGIVYHWQAFGNAYKPESRTGAADFAVGSYVGSGEDNRSIRVLPYQLDFITIKQNGNVPGVFRTSAHAGDTSSFFTATADTSNLVQSFTNDGFQVGTQTNVNSSGTLYRWFGFKQSPHFIVDSFTGTGIDNQSVNPANGFEPELVWVKRTTASNFVHRGASLPDDSSQYFTQTFNAADRIQTFSSSGFVLGTNAEVNASGGSYHYAMWGQPPAGSLGVGIVDGAGQPFSAASFTLTPASYAFSCTVSNGTLGSTSQKIRIVNSTTSPGWTVTIAATQGGGAVWQPTSQSTTYDFNDPGGSPVGCADSDGDGVAGQLVLDPSSATLLPGAGCTTTGVSLGSPSAFTSSTPITLATASAGASAACSWDLLGLPLQQTIPAHQAEDTYQLNLTVTITAS